MLEWLHALMAKCSSCSDYMHNFLHTIVATGSIIYMLKWQHTRVDTCSSGNIQLSTFSSYNMLDYLHIIVATWSIVYCLVIDCQHFLMTIASITLEATFPSINMLWYKTCLIVSLLYDWFSTYPSGNMRDCLHALLATHSTGYMLWWQYAPLSTYSCGNMLDYLYFKVATCLIVYMFNDWLSTCFGGNTLAVYML